MAVSSNKVVADIKTPCGLKLGTRVCKDGKNGLRYKQGKRYDILTAKDAVECIEGIRVKKLIIIPEDA